MCRHASNARHWTRHSQYPLVRLPPSPLSVAPSAHYLALEGPSSPASSEITAPTITIITSVSTELEAPMPMATLREARRNVRRGYCGGCPMHVVDHRFLHFAGGKFQYRSTS